MYREHFQLREKPFTLIPDPGYLHFSDKHKTAYSLLEYGLWEQTGITVITGEVGSGKTTLLRHLLTEIDQKELSIGMINNTHAALGDITQWIASAFGIDHEGRDKVALFEAIQSFLIAEWGAGKRAVLIVDEAQNLSAETLEELRLYNNINSDGYQLLQIILVGQPELRDTLRLPELSQMAQRVSVEYHIQPLNWQETANYIRHRMATAATPEGKKDAARVFDSVAMAVIFYFSAGVPRLINTLCDFALVHAYAKNASVVDLEVALEVVKGRTIGGVNRFSNNKAELDLVSKRVKEAIGLDLDSLYEEITGDVSSPVEAHH